jgi:hypothetical protein
MFRKIKLVSAIFLLFLVTGSCSKDDNSGGGGPQASPTGMGSQAISASSAVAGPLISLINNIFSSAAQQANVQSSTQAFGLQHSSKQFDGPVSIPCEQGTVVTVTATGVDQSTGLPTGLHVEANPCITNGGAVTLALTAEVTNIVPSLCGDLAVPSSLEAVINGTFTETQDSTSVDFAMNNLKMVFSDIAWRPSDCTITSLTDDVSGVITTALQGQTITLDYGTGSLTFIVQVNSDVDPTEVTISVSGDMTITSPCYTGTFHIETDPDVPIKFVEGQILPVEGKVTLTRVSGDPFPDTTVDFADPATRNLPFCIGTIGDGGGGGGTQVACTTVNTSEAGPQPGHRIHADIFPDGGGEKIGITACAAFECTLPTEGSPCLLQIFDIEGPDYFQFDTPMGQCLSFSAGLTDNQDRALQLNTGAPNREFGKFDPNAKDELTGEPIEDPFASGTVSDAQGNPVGIFEFYDYDRASGDFGFKDFIIPNRTCPQ